MKKQISKDRSLTIWLTIFLGAIVFLLAYVGFINWHKGQIQSLENQNNELIKKIERLEESLVQSKMIP